MKEQLVNDFNKAQLNQILAVCSRVTDERQKWVKSEMSMAELSENLIPSILTDMNVSSMLVNFLVYIGCCALSADISRVQEAMEDENV